MSQIVKLRRSSISGQKPTNTNLQLGELALNTTDGKVFFAKSGSLGPTVEELVSTNTVNTGSIHLTGDVTASHFTGSFIGDGSQIYNIPLSGVTNLVTISGSLDNRLDVLEAYSSSQLVPSASMSFRTLQTDVYCKNVTGVQINKGTVVRIVGATGDNPLIAPADLLTEGSSANTLGIATENIPNDSFGLIITEGVLTGVNTDGMTAGALLFLGANGTFTTTPPVAPNHGVRLGEVLRVQQNNGSIYVRIDNGIELNEAHDVIYSGISHGDLLVRSGSVWKNSKSLEGNYTVTGSLTVTQNLTVLGSSSLVYVTSSNLAVSASFISVNVFEPAERFGGLKVYDSGSSNATASLAWDSQHNHWVYQNVSGSQYSGGMLLSGPRNSGSLGDEPGLIDGRIVKSVGGDHLDVSIISETGTTINIGGNLVANSITGAFDFFGLVNRPTLVSGSSQIDITGTTGYSTFSSSIKDRIDVVTGSITDLSSSIATTTNLLDGRIDSLETESGSIRSDFNSFTSSYTTGAFTGSFIGDGVGLYNIPASGVTGLQLDKIVSGNASASIDNTGLRVNRDVYIDGILTAKELHIDYVTSSVLYQSGSTKFGDTTDDTHQFTGSVYIDGNLNVDSITGSIDFSNITNKPTLVSGSSQISYTGITDVPNGIVSGSLQIVDLGFTTTSSFESFTSSYNTDSQSFDSRINNFTASINSLNSFSSSVVLTSQTSSMTVLSASYAVTAAFALNAGSGGSGGASLGSYTSLDQTIAATTWSFAHNTGQRYPIFQVFNSSGDVIIPTQIRTIDDNNAQIIFGSAQTGKAIASLGGGNGTTQEFTNSALWTVNHNLGTDYPDVTIWDSNRNIIFPNRIESVDSNQIKVYFSVPVSGHVSVSRGGHIISGSVDLEWNNILNKPAGLVSGSSQISFNGLSSVPSGLVSSSSQISYTSISNIPSGIVSGSSQLTGSYDTRYVLSGSITQTTWDNIANKPAGIVSGSVQVELTGTTGYSTFSSSINTSISGSVSNLSSSIASTDSTQNGRLNSLETTSASLLLLSSSIDNAFEFTGSNVTIKGDFLIKGTTTIVESTTLNIGDNIVSLNGTGATNAGLVVRDATNPNTVSGSLLWDSTNDYWIAGDLGNEERIILEGDFNSFTSSYNTGSFTGSFTGNGSGLTNLSNITGSVGQVAILSSDKTVSGSQFTYVTNQTFGLGTAAVTLDEPERLMVDNFNSYNIATFQTSQQETYAEVNIKNFGSGSSSSADLVLWNDVSTPSSSFLDLGINSSNYNAGYVGYGGDGYLFNHSNDLYLGSMDPVESGHGHVHIFGGGMWDSSSISIYSDGTIGVNTDKENTNASTIPSSGDGYAVEISGSVYFRNNVSVSGFANVTGSLNVTGGITGSIDYSNITNKPTLVSGSSQIIYSGLTGIPNNIVSGSEQLTGSYDTRYVLSGSITQTTWDNIANKPNDIVSSSSQISSFGFLETSSFNTYTSSNDDRVSLLESITGSYATTGSNSFIGNENINGNLSVTGSVVISGSLDITNANVGSSRYLHTQTSTSATWSISHNLGYDYPNVTVYDGATNKVMLPSDVTSINGNTTEVTFATPEYGYALVSVGGITTATADRYLHTVTTATGSWVIDHNLGYKYPNIDVYDEDDEQLIPQVVKAVSVNRIQIDFATPTSGNAIITLGGPRSTSIFNQTGSFYTTQYDIGITGSLVVTGDVDASSFNTTSDKLLKTNLERIEGALDKIEQLNGYTFDWVSDYSDDKTRQIGMIANEVHAVQPELISNRTIMLGGKEEEILLLDYSKVTALLIEAVKELNDKVKKLENKRKKK